MLPTQLYIHHSPFIITELHKKRRRKTTYISIMEIATPIHLYARIRFPDGATTWYIDHQCQATAIDETGLETRTVTFVLRHQQTALEVWTALPIPRRFRILLVEYNIDSIERAVIGYIAFNRTAGEVRISDYRMLLARGTMPTIFHNDTIYVQGLRLEFGLPLPLRIETIEAGVMLNDHLVELVTTRPRSSAIRCEARLRLHPQIVGTMATITDPTTREEATTADTNTNDALSEFEVAWEPYYVVTSTCTYRSYRRVATETAIVEPPNQTTRENTVPLNTEAINSVAPLNPPMPTSSNATRTEVMSTLAGPSNQTRENVASTNVQVTPYARAHDHPWLRRNANPITNSSTSYDRYESEPPTNRFAEESERPALRYLPAVEFEREPNYSGNRRTESMEALAGQVDDPNGLQMPTLSDCDSGDEDTPSAHQLIDRIRQSRQRQEDALSDYNSEFGDL